MGLFDNIKLSDQFFDELFTQDKMPRPAVSELLKMLGEMGEKELNDREKAVKLAIKLMGISFTVYSDGANIDREWPFDIIPRVIPSYEWNRVTAGLTQRVQALNLFIDDVYNGAKIIKDKVVPEFVVKQSKGYREECVGFSPKFATWAHICGSDLVRDQEGKYFVLEDNLRVPSGVSYMLENRQVMKRIFPEIFQNQNILPIADYTMELNACLSSLCPREGSRPNIVVLTPGIFNSAYFEHSYLAQQIGATLVEGCDLIVRNKIVYMKTIDGPARVDVIYRRIDDDFMDPEVFRKDSTLGVAGLMEAWKAGNVAIANAPGAGVADDKVIYSFVPDMIRYYLDQEPLIDNVPTYLCYKDDERQYVIDHISELVVKPASEAGGYGLLIGPKASKQECEQFVELIKENPRNYIAQPTLNLSTNPILCRGELAPRHVDLRPFILQGQRNYVTRGGLTRVALVEGSLVVNSSQGGGSQDTWVLDCEEVK